MSMPGGKCFLSVSTHSIEPTPTQTSQADLVRNIGSWQENRSIWKSRKYQPLLSPIDIESKHPRYSSQGSIICSPIMSHCRLSKSEQGDHTKNISDTDLFSNKLLFKDCADTIPVPFTRFKVHDKFQALSRPYDKEMLSKLDPKGKNKHELSPSDKTANLFYSSTQDIPSSSHLIYRQQIPTESFSLPGIPNRTIRSKNSSSHRPDLASISSLCNQTKRMRDSRLPHDTIDVDKLSVPSFSGCFANKIQISDDRYNSNLKNRNSSMHRVSFEPKDEYKDDRNFTLVNEKSYCKDLHSSIFTSGRKRRFRPPNDDENTSFYSVKSPRNFLERGDSVASRNSTDLNFHSQSGSSSSTASETRNNSYSSTISSAISSKTSVASFGGLSPDGISPKCTDDTGPSYNGIQSSNSIRRGSSIRSTAQPKSSHDSKTLTKTAQSSESASYTRQCKTMPNLTGIFICECCPKKPKRFDNKEDLEAHEQEKQYECAYCRNRFKNKNEAERHQNSLHLRRHSWSCTALSSYAAAFHNSTIRPGEADTCGFCGKDFPRSNIVSGIPIITIKDWDIRINHLTDVHKFGECNHDKKFFRADHFRQHLKHSHAGTSGKWTNVLENACMRDEPVQIATRRSSENINTSGSQLPNCDIVSAVDS